MALTIADVERWNAGDVREVFHAASSRAQAAQDAADGIATLPAFTTWGGKAADAAREAIAATGEQLKAHSAEVKSVANTARTAADEIERIQSELATLKSDAAALDMEIDPTTNQVVEGPGFKGTAMESLLKRQQLQPRVDKLLAEANFIDFALAGAINRADGSTGSAETPRPQPPGPSKAVVDAVQQPSAVGQEGKPGTWQDLLLPGGAAVPGTDAGDLAPTLQDQLTPPDARVPGTAANLDGFLFPPGTPLPGPPPSLMDRFNATRKAAGLLPLDPRADPEFIAQARDLLAQQGIPADQIDQRLGALIDMMERPVADLVPPERQRQPAPGFGDGFRESWFANEDFVKGLIGQAGPGAPGVWESWKNLGLGIGGTIADPIGAIQDEIERAKNAPSLAHYLGGWTADISQSAVAGPFLGPEALAGRVAVRGIADSYDDYPDLRDAPPSSSGPAPGPHSSTLEIPTTPPSPIPPSLTLDSPLFDGYQPTPPGPEFTKPDGSLLYPDSSDPSKPYAVPGTVIENVQLPSGTLIDRFGSPYGSWLAPDGTPYSERALPPPTSDPTYSRYVVADPTLLPPGFKIEQSQAVPWFHQPGLGTQFRILGPDNKDAPVSALVESGYLKDANG